MVLVIDIPVTLSLYLSTPTSILCSKNYQIKTFPQILGLGFLLIHQSTHFFNFNFNFNFNLQLYSRNMYADRIEGSSKPSIADRLNDNTALNSVSRHSVTGKRQRQDDKWEHDLFTDSRPQIKHKLGGGDLRLKLQRKSNQLDIQGGGVRDLRDLLSGSMHSQQVKKDAPKPRPAPEAPKPKSATRNVVVESPVLDVKKVHTSTLKKNTQQKDDTSVDGFLESLGLEKYQIIFQAEEVDMTALEHMTDEDLKAMGIPMGPRKKIILALNSKS